MSRPVRNHPVPHETAARLTAMPKVEIHVHLEGATDATTVWAMARRNRVELPVDSLGAWRRFYEFRDFDHFIEIYELATSCMRTPEDYVAMVESFLERQAAQNVRYSEAYFSPQLHLGRDLSAEAILEALARGAELGRRRHHTGVRFLADLSRQMPERLEDVVPFALAGRERDGLFVGLGIGGAEIGHPPERFADIFAEAREANLRVVAHAGETAGPESVWGALRHLRAERIGHGVRALEDPDLVAHLRETGIPLEVSPTSNYRLKVVPSHRPHPIRTMVDRGLLVTVNSDDPPMFSTDLTREYLALAAQGFTWDELWELGGNAIEASFLDESEKDALRAERRAFLDSIGRP